MKATDELKEEHRAIEKMLRVITAVSDRLAAGDAVPAEHLNLIVDFIRGFADRCHHGKEEDLLFRAMEDVGFGRNEGPVGVMLMEHEEGRDFVRAMAAAAARYAAGEKAAARDFAANARGYVAVLSRHIPKEDNILYPMADAHLSAAQQHALEEGFARVEREVVGPGRHDAYGRDLEMLMATYGVTG